MSEKKETIVIPSNDEVLEVTETADEIDIVDVGNKKSAEIVGDKAAPDVMPM